MDIILSLSITLAFELGITTIFFFKDMRVLVVLSIANIVLNVTMNLSIQLMPNALGYYLFLGFYELFTTAIEIIILIFICKKPVRKSILVSVCANVTSLGVGIIINQCNPDEKTKMILTLIFAFIYSVIVAINLSFYLLDKTKN